MEKLVATDEDFSPMKWWFLDVLWRPAQFYPRLVLFYQRRCDRRYNFAGV